MSASCWPLRKALTELFHRYKQPVYGFFGRRISDPANAEELTQETFFALLRSRYRYEPRALFRTYLYAISFKILRAHRPKAAFRATFLARRNSLLDPSKTRRDRIRHLGSPRRRET